MIIATKQPVLVMEEVTDPVELAKARILDERFQKNWDWFNERALEIYNLYRGKCLCIAGQELFVGDTPAEALDAARAAHPDDNGLYLRTIPREKACRIYAH